ncbi:hypothetical protein [Antrihabitans sp. YC2-6]|uniref:hypothetical protein n=1 Tax=Antrihabitans sp. YC2-6 TaxID=2799498 RepID=UPI0018F4D2EA|nr:hypothetical protein [Antrihabitans sp. YC2-6]MBJ8346921.1 hypothetical protein [Antrihabitans sp. YC2-6]
MIIIWLGIAAAVFLLGFVDALGWWLWPVAGVLVLIWAWLAVAERRRTKRVGEAQVQEERTGTSEMPQH